MFKDLVNEINRVSNIDFIEASNILNQFIDEDNNFLDILKQIGTIPESIDHDSTEEKLFSKASDAVLTKAFREIGLKSTVLTERGDSADVIAESKIYGYTLVADAKAFRMSRTAKNQKDFKVVLLSGWRKDADYSVLCSPYFQYPNRKSQIFQQAIDNNVCLLSWEHMIFLIQNGIRESVNLNLSPIWNFGEEYAKICLCSDRNKSFTGILNELVMDLLGYKIAAFNSLLDNQIQVITDRGQEEKSFWESEIANIRQYSREQAIEELIKSKKIMEKLNQIDSYVRSLKL